MTDTPWYLKNYRQSLLGKTGRILPKVELALVKKVEARNALRDTQHLHPSEISKKDWCPRASWYTITGAPKAAESFAFNRLNIFEEGNAIHSKWQNWLWESGMLVGRWSCRECSTTWFGKSPLECPDCHGIDITYREVPLWDDEHRIIGHADGEIEDDKGRALIEIKSVGIGSVRWDKPALYADYESGKLTLDEVWKNIKTPFPAHIRQGNIYMHCRKVDTIVFIYEWKPSQQVKEFEVKFNPEVVAPLLEGCKLVMKHLDDQTPPDRPTWAVSKTCSGCKFCPFKKECFS